MGVIEDARAACDSYRWGDAYRLLSGVELETLDVDDLDRLATSAYLTGHDEDGFTYWVRAHQMCIADGARAPGGVFRREGCPGARLQGRPRPLPRMDRPHRPPPGGRGHRLRRAGLPRVRVGG